MRMENFVHLTQKYKFKILSKIYKKIILILTLKRKNKN
jgi:hypothetical protein